MQPKSNISNTYMPSKTPRRRLSPPRQEAVQVTGLHVLPPDCMAMVLGCLTPATLGRLLQASHAWHRQAATAALWRVHCLVIWPYDSFETGPPSPAHYSRRCNLFRRRVLCGTALGSLSAAAARAVKAMGGSWDDALTNMTTHLLCGATHVRAHFCHLHSTPSHPSAHTVLPAD